MNIDSELEATGEETSETPVKQPLNLGVDVHKKSSCERHVKVTIPREDIDRYFKTQFDDLVPKAEVAGFRAGKAPRQLIESRFRKQVADQVKGSLLIDSLAQISEGDHFSAISEPDLAYDKVDIPEDGPMTFEFDIEVRPEFQMPSWKGMTLERPEREVTEAEIDWRVEMLRKRQADVIPVEGPIIAGDTAVCNLKGTLDGKGVFSADELSVRVLPLLSMVDAKVEGFDKLMIGANSGEKRTTVVEVSEFAENAELQGKKVELEFEVLDVKRTEANTDEEMVARYGGGSIGAIKDMIASSLKNQLAYEQRQSLRNQISRTLTDAAGWDLPPDLLRRQFRRELNRALMEMKSSGFSESEIQARENVLRQDALRRTETLLKEHFILERIAEEENIEDSPQDYEAEISRIAQSSNDSPRRVRAKMERTGQMDVLRNMIIERKVIELIEENAQVTVVPAKPFAHETVEAIDIAIGGTKVEHIPEAKYDDQPQQPIPGSAAATAKTSIG